ncbi:MAG: hypothetical protein QNJ97_03355 [Myxococcota bacterium]|nr:hypothetical protein [Myxococcota bacterium]
MRKGPRAGEYILNMEFDGEDPEPIGCLKYEILEAKYYDEGFQNDFALPTPVKTDNNTPPGTQDSIYRLKSGSMFTFVIRGTNMTNLPGATIAPPVLEFEFRQNGKVVTPPIYLGRQSIVDLDSRKGLISRQQDESPQDFFNRTRRPLRGVIPVAPIEGSTVWAFVGTPQSMGRDTPYRAWYVRKIKEEQPDERYQLNVSLVICGKLYKFDPEVIVEH